MKSLVIALLVASSFSAYADTTWQCKAYNEYVEQDANGDVGFKHFTMNNENGVETQYNNAFAAAARFKPLCELSNLPSPKLGMTTKQVAEKSNWGKPDQINRYGNASGTREQWVYDGRGYLYFTNNKLTSWQN